MAALSMTVVQLERFGSGLSPDEEEPLAAVAMPGTAAIAASRHEVYGVD